MFQGGGGHGRDAQTEVRLRPSVRCHVLLLLTAVRFNMGMTEEEVVQFVETMVAESHASWRTQIYDHFQYITNGIMS